MRQKFQALMVDLAPYGTPTERCECSNNYAFIELILKDRQLKTVNGAITKINRDFKDWKIQHAGTTGSMLIFGLKKS